MTKEKILFLTYAPFDPEVHITDQILEDLPIQKVVSVKNCDNAQDMTVKKAINRVNHIINTARAELVRAKDVPQKEMCFANDYIEVISKEGSSRSGWDYELACAFADYYKHVYVVDAEIGEQYYWIDLHTNKSHED